MTMDGCELDHDLGEDSWYYAYSCCWSAPEPLGAKEELTALGGQGLMEAVLAEQPLSNFRSSVVPESGFRSLAGKLRKFLSCHT